MNNLMHIQMNIKKSENKLLDKRMNKYINNKYINNQINK